MESSIKHIQVALGVVIKNDKFFVCRRQAHQDLSNKWEFAGGKIDTGETSLQALSRELIEEIAIYVDTANLLTTIDFAYPSKHLSLHVYLVTGFSGQARGAEGQESKWVTFSELQSLDFPAANLAILEKLAPLYS